MRNMKKIIMIVTSVLILSSCGVIGAAGSIAGETIKAAGNVAGAAIKTTGNIIGGINGGNEGEINAKGVKHKFAKAKVENDGNTTVVTGVLSHNGSSKKNVKLEVPCFDKKGDKIGDAVDTIDSLEKNKKWEFRAVINSGDVKSCKVKDSYVSAE